MNALESAQALVDAFARSDTAAYFAAFSPDATFVFHSHLERLESRAEYEELWQSWEHDEDFRIVQCQSTNKLMQDLGDVAVFTHDVETTVSTSGGEDRTFERETIVLRRSDDGWIAVHEHLSLDPNH